MMLRIILSAVVFLAAGCNPHVTIGQSKPIEINFNFSGRLDLVIHAQQDMETITGEKPTNTVRPEDIGLAPAAGGAMGHADGPVLAGSGAAAHEEFVPVLLKNERERAEGLAPPRRTVRFVAAVDDLKKSMAARNPQVRALWDAQLVGENHSGLLEGKGKLTPEQKKLMDDENADRTALFAAEAKAAGTKVEDVALAFYVARLGYAKKDAWFEKKNAAGEWEWKHWGS